MSEQEQTAEGVVDFDAFTPASPRRLVKVDGQTYGLLDLFDLRRRHLNELLSFEKRAQTMSAEEQFAELKTHIQRLMPSMPDAVLDDMPLRRIGALFAFIQRLAAPKADADSFPSSPNESS